MTSPNNIDEKDSKIKTFEADLKIENLIGLNYHYYILIHKGDRFLID